MVNNEKEDDVQTNQQIEKMKALSKAYGQHECRGFVRVQLFVEFIGDRLRHERVCREMRTRASGSSLT